MTCSTDQIDLDTFQAMIAESAAQLLAARDKLSALDAATGDGDHGAAMSKVADAIVSSCSTSHDNLASFFHDLGWAIMETNSGSTGPLFGSFFLGMSKSITQTSLTPPELANAFVGGITELRTITKANVGDKTMLDALIPAVEAIHDAANSDVSTLSVLHAGVIAAEEGAAATKGMQAKFGRAKNIGERSVGHVDPGATSVALLFRGFEKGFQHA